MKLKPFQSVQFWVFDIFNSFRKNEEIRIYKTNVDEVEKYIDIYINFHDFSYLIHYMANEYGHVFEKYQPEIGLGYVRFFMLPYDNQIKNIRKQKLKKIYDQFHYQ